MKNSNKSTKRTAIAQPVKSTPFIAGADIDDLQSRFSNEARKMSEATASLSAEIDRLKQSIIQRDVTINALHNASLLKDAQINGLFTQVESAHQVATSAQLVAESTLKMFFVSLRPRVTCEKDFSGVRISNKISIPDTCLN